MNPTPAPCADTDYPCQQVVLLTSINASSADLVTECHILHGASEFIGLLLTILIFVNLGWGAVHASQNRRGQ